jgi:hypothetical protein
MDFPAKKAQISLYSVAATMGGSFQRAVIPTKDLAIADQCLLYLHPRLYQH